MIDYTVDCSATLAHQFHVQLRIGKPAVGQVLSLPVWIPGSYMVREFARHLSGLEASQGGLPVAVQQLDKATWQVANATRKPLLLCYSVYALEPSVRAAWLDAQRGFFNGTSLFLRVQGQEQQPHRVRLHGLPSGWQVATSMPAGRGRQVFEASGYDDLVDHPFELGAFWRGQFQVRDIPHEFIVAGAWPGFDGERLLVDCQCLCEQVVSLWHGAGKPPFERYVFMLNASEHGYGGLEHRASTALMATRRDLPRRDQAAGDDGYTNLLGLIGHEYFHAWNVKRLRPSELATIDYTRENTTELLWFFEGFTTYYEDLLLLRAGRVDAAGYLRLLAKAVQSVVASPGRQVQSVAQASFDAWVKYYRPDENSPNATINYYTKGALVALCLDAGLRARGKATLDDLMRALWRYSEGGPITEADILAQVKRLGGAALAQALVQWVHGTDELPLTQALQGLGVALNFDAPTLAECWGLRVSESALTGVAIKHVLQGGAAQAAGLAPGDELWAVAGWRLRRLEDARAWLPLTGPVPLLVARDQRVLALSLQPPLAAPQGTARLAVVATPRAAALAQRRAWLDG
jgi:predicted metalloprotease with PDZ domain